MSDLFVFPGQMETTCVEDSKAAQNNVIEMESEEGSFGLVTCFGCLLESNVSRRGMGESNHLGISLRVAKHWYQSVALSLFTFIPLSQRWRTAPQRRHMRSKAMRLGQGPFAWTTTLTACFKPSTMSLGVQIVPLAVTMTSLPWKTTWR